MNDQRQTDSMEIVVFALDEGRYALPLALVERVVRAVAVTPLPKAPAMVLGVINAWGQVTPVIGLRRLLGLPERPLALEDRFLLARTTRRPLALVADSVVGVTRLEDRPHLAGRELSFAPYLQGVAELPDGLVLIYDLDEFLSLDQERQLDAALAGGA